MAIEASAPLPIAENGIAALTSVVLEAWCAAPTASIDPHAIETVVEALG